MAPYPVQAVREFIAHIEAQSRARREALSSGAEFLPSAEERARRESLMQNLLPALGMTREELQSQLGIDRATWDRWRAITSVPHRSYLETMARYAAERVSTEHEQAKLPPAHEMLSATPRTWGRLRLVYCIFPWKNAVFGFKTPYYDYATVTEMALLALRGCRIIYILSGAKKWRSDFANSLVEVLGKNYAALALSRICIIEIPEALAKKMPAFGLFNYETKDPVDCVGYTWTDVPHLKKRPSDNQSGLYEAFPATDDRYTDVRDKFWLQIQKAFIEIHDRVPPDFWSPNRDAAFRQELLKIPIVTYREDQTSNPVDDDNKARDIENKSTGHSTT